MTDLIACLHGHGRGGGRHLGRFRVSQRLPVSDATDLKDGDPIPAQGSLAPEYVSRVETRIILGYGLRAGVTSCIVVEASRAREGREARPPSSQLARDPHRWRLGEVREERANPVTRTWSRSLWIRSTGRGTP